MILCEAVCERGPMEAGQSFLCKERRLQGLLPGHLRMEGDGYLSVRQFIRLPWTAFLAICTW